MRQLWQKRSLSFISKEETHPRKYGLVRRVFSCAVRLYGLLHHADQSSTTIQTKKGEQ